MGGSWENRNEQWGDGWQWGGNWGWYAHKRWERPLGSEWTCGLCGTKQQSTKRMRCVKCGLKENHTLPVTLKQTGGNAPTDAATPAHPTQPRGNPIRE